MSGPTTRITIPLYQEAIDRLRFLAGKFEISHAKLVTCLLNLPDEEVSEIVARNADLLAESKAALIKRNKEMRKVFREKIKSIPPEKLDKLLALLEENKDD